MILGLILHPTYKFTIQSSGAKVYSTDTNFHPPTVIMGVKGVGGGHKLIARLASDSTQSGKQASEYINVEAVEWRYILKLRIKT